MKIWMPLLALALLLAGCAQEQGIKVVAPEEIPAEETSEKETLAEPESAFDAVNECIEACRTATIPLDNGPCILNPIENTDWVCDVAHQPRQDIDNQIENQCSAYREGKARHFVEVSTDCTLIKKV